LLGGKGNQDRGAAVKIPASGILVWGGKVRVDCAGGSRMGEDPIPNPYYCNEIFSGLGRAGKLITS
jgi:hypothetical protein